MKKKTFSIEVELSETQVKAIAERVPTPIPEGRKIAGVAVQALIDLAGGGMVLDGPTVEQITGIAGPVEDTQQLVALLEAAANRDQGRMVGKWYIDPTYEPVLKDMAENQGLTVDQVVTSLMDWGVAQGWAYQMAPDTITQFFLKEDFFELCRILGTGFPTGTDIVRWMKNITSDSGNLVAAGKKEEVIG